MLKQPIELKLPAERSMMLVLRLTTAGVVARAGLGVDRMDDVKMAVEEACNCIIGDDGAAQTLRLTFQTAEKNLLIRICADDGCSAARAEEEELSVVRCILESLVDGVDVRVKEDRLSGVELRVALSA